EKYFDAATRTVSPEEMEDLEVEETEETLEEAMVEDGAVPFSISRRLSRKKEKFVKSIKGFARRSIRRDNKNGDSSGDVVKDEVTNVVDREQETATPKLVRERSTNDFLDRNEEAIEK
ncbi:hypothetical protein PMAYCL1PPCAC_33194, partial [Pristionchus mayeri]